MQQLTRFQLTACHVVPETDEHLTMN